MLSLGLHLGPGIAQPHSAVEYKPIGSAIGIEAEIALPLELNRFADRRLRECWFDRLLGPERKPRPTNAHVHYLRRVSPLESTYSKEKAVEICLATTLALGFDMTAIPNIHLDLEDLSLIHISEPTRH